jgi:hypothetical protein
MLFGCLTNFLSDSPPTSIPVIRPIKLVENFVDFIQLHIIEVVIRAILKCRLGLWVLNSPETSAK